MRMPANYPGGFTHGLVVRGLPILQAQPGKVYWVGNGTSLSPGTVGGHDGGPGTHQRPLATLQTAINKCTAGAGDIILIKPGHAETIANATTVVLNKAGVAIVGLGVGSSRPTFTFATNTTANIPITAANVSLQNLLFVANRADIVSTFTVTGTATPTDFSIEGCEFRDTSSILNFIAILTGNATANSLSGLRFCRNRISSLGTTAATCAINFLEAADRVTIQDNFGNWAILNDTACMVYANTFSLTNFDFARNVLNKPNTSSTGGSFVSSSGNAWTGHCYDNYLWQLDGTSGTWINTGTKLAFSNNYSPITGAADKSGLINPAAA